MRAQKTHPSNCNQHFFMHFLSLLPPFFNYSERSIWLLDCRQISQFLLLSLILFHWLHYQPQKTIIFPIIFANFNDQTKVLSNRNILNFFSVQLFHFRWRFTFFVKCSWPTVGESLHSPLGGRIWKSVRVFLIRFSLFLAFLSIPRRGK